MITSFKMAATAALLVLSGTAQAAPGSCKLVFEGETYIDGPCDIEPSDDGGFRATADGHELQLKVFSGTGEAQWNGALRGRTLAQALHADGPLRSQEACWLNKSVLLCTWATQRPGAGPSAAAPVRQEAARFRVNSEDSVGSWTLVQIKRNGRVDHCEATSTADASTPGGPLRLALDSTGRWSLSAPANGRGKGFTGPVNAEFAKSTGQLLARVDAFGHRMHLPLSAEDLRALEAGQTVQLGFGRTPLYRLDKTRLTVAALQRCVKG